MSGVATSLARRALAAAPPTLLGELTRAFAPGTGGAVLAAVSGGADSVALAHLLAALAPGRGWRVELASLDHGWRGSAGTRDRAFVEALAGALGLAFRGGRLADAPRTEREARDGRRAFLERERERLGEAALIALAHTRDDQAETLLFRLARGTGLAGAAAMARYDPPLWRPLLGVPRDELRSYLQTLGAEWREDETNLSPEAARNRLRHDVLPRLERARPGAAAGLARAAELAREDEELLAALAARALEAALLERAPGLRRVDRRALAAHPAALRRRCLRLLVAELAPGHVPSATQTRAADAIVLAEGHGTALSLPGGCALRRRGGTLEFTTGAVRAGAPRSGEDAPP